MYIQMPKSSQVQYNSILSRVDSRMNRIYQSYKETKTMVFLENLTRYFVIFGINYMLLLYLSYKGVDNSTAFLWAFMVYICLFVSFKFLPYMTDKQPMDEYKAFARLKRDLLMLKDTFVLLEKIKGSEKDETGGSLEELEINGVTRSGMRVQYMGDTYYVITNADHIYADEKGENIIINFEWLDKIIKEVEEVC